MQIYARYLREDQYSIGEGDKRGKKCSKTEKTDGQEKVKLKVGGEQKKKKKKLRSSGKREKKDESKKKQEKFNTANVGGGNQNGISTTKVKGESAIKRM